MNLAQLKASRALWLRREKYRYARWHWFRYRSHRKPADRLRLRTKWWTLYAQAHAQRIARDQDIVKATPKPSVRQQTINHARTFVGQTEHPAGSNQGPGIVSRCQIEILGSDGYPWCGCFCGSMLNWAGVKGVNSRIAGVAAIEDDARAHRAPFSGWSDTAHSALRGDLVVLFGKGVHVAMIEKVYADGSVDTCEGNTSPPNGSGSQSNGGGVWARHRPASDIHGVAHVRYP